MRKILYYSLLCLVAIVLLGSCEKGYERSFFGKVTFNGQKVNVQHWWSFEALSAGYARDKVKGYYRGIVISDSDGETFEYVWGNFAKDKNHVYLCTTHKPFVIIEYVPSVRTNHIYVLDEDPDQFIVLDNHFAKGNNYVYVFSDTLNSADASSFESLGEGFAKDKNIAFYGSDILSNVDVSTFRRINGYYAADKSSVFYMDSMIRNADAKSFEVLVNDDYAKDANNFYEGYEKIENKDIDIATFQFYENSLYAFDKTNVYYRTTLIHGADKETFIKDVSYAKDKNNYYKGEKIVKEGDSGYERAVKKLGKK